MDWAVVKQPWGYCLKYLWIQEASTYRPRQDYRRSYRCLSGIWVSFRPIFLFCTYRKLQITIWEEFTGSENHQHHEYWIPPVMAIWLYNECVTLSHLRSKGVSVVKMWCITTTVLQVCYNFPSVLQHPSGMWYNFPLECIYLCHDFHQKTNANKLNYHSLYGHTI